MEIRAAIWTGRRWRAVRSVRSREFRSDGVAGKWISFRGGVDGLVRVAERRAAKLHPARESGFHDCSRSFSLLHVLVEHNE